MTIFWIILGALVLFASLFGWGAVILAAKADEETERIFNREKKDPAELQCPVCGYYCLGNGGVGCIDKPYLVKNQRNHE